MGTLAMILKCTAGLACLGYVASHANPIRSAASGVIRVLAATYLIREMAKGAWARRDRWRECLDRARREV